MISILPSDPRTQRSDTSDLRVPNRDVELVLDLSRLIARMRHTTPTGIDRVELAYARELQRRLPDQLSFAAVHPSGIYGRIPTPRAAQFLDEVERGWTMGADRTANNAAAALPGLMATLMLVRPMPIPRSLGPRVVIQSSPHHLHREHQVRAILSRERAAFLCLLHDLIPIDYPEYARPGGNDRHRKRIRTVAGLADAVIANSHDTARLFEPYLAQAGRAEVPVAVAHLGLGEMHSLGRFLPTTDPYFVCIGTIEPRKNHLLLLNLWRRMVEERRVAQAGPVPKLVLVGRRGWENEQVIDMLERCPALVGLVEERVGLPDHAMQTLLAGSLGLLLPSFAEGFGMPVPEALALGVPVLCSDLPALREAGGDAPQYLDPLDGPAWYRAILSLIDPRGSARAAQLARIATWRSPTWADHLSIVLDQAARLARPRSVR